MISGCGCAKVARRLRPDNINSTAVLLEIGNWKCQQEPGSIKIEWWRSCLVAWVFGH